MQRLNNQENESLLYQCFEHNKTLNGTNSWWSRSKRVLTAYTGINDITFSKNDINYIFSQLKVRFQDYWHFSLHNDTNSPHGNKLRKYRLYKTSYCKEPYLNLCDYVKRKHLASLRLSCHKLHIETGRHVHVTERLDPSDRKCSFCQLQTCEDEFHFVMICPHYTTLRNNFMLSIRTKFPYISDYS
jgi:hypothetical protein